MTEPVINIEEFRQRDQKALYSKKGVDLLKAKASKYEEQIALVNESGLLCSELDSMSHSPCLTLRESHLQHLCIKASDLIKRLYK